MATPTAKKAWWASWKRQPIIMRGQQAFTLFEIILVVAIIGTLAAFLIRNLTTSADNVKVDQAKLAMMAVGSALNMYRIHNNRYPDTGEGLKALLNNPNPGENKRWRGPYIEEEKLEDPWGVQFEYELTEPTKFKITSAGLDMQHGTADDIVYPEPSGSSPGPDAK
jgi:general secretion pathway protein G